jgi:hypothetical protein
MLGAGVVAAVTTDVASLRLGQGIPQVTWEFKDFALLQANPMCIVFEQQLIRHIYPRVFNYLHLHLHRVATP